MGTLHQRHISARTRGDSFCTPGHLQSLERKVGTTLNEKMKRQSVEVKGTGGEGGIRIRLKTSNKGLNRALTAN
jgi:hypothetical protein